MESKLIIYLFVSVAVILATNALDLRSAYQEPLEQEQQVDVAAQGEEVKDGDDENRFFYCEQYRISCTSFCRPSNFTAANSCVLTKCFFFFCFEIARCPCNMYG